jgi:hypothetical protein
MNILLNVFCILSADLHLGQEYFNYLTPIWVCYGFIVWWFGGWLYVLMLQACTGVYLPMSSQP